MIKYLIPIAFLAAGCTPRVCTVEPGQPLPIGSCVIGAGPGESGGQCIPGEWGSPDTCDTAFACVGGTCYDCGKSGEPCCGSQTAAADGWCDPGEGTCGSAPGNEFYSCVGGTSAPPASDCDPGQAPNFYVWTLDLICSATLQGLCAYDQSSAEMLVADMYGSVQHGPVGTDPNSIAPIAYYECGADTDCTVSDGTMATTFYAFTPAQVTTCEHNLDPGCTWTDSSNDTCPM